MAFISPAGIPARPLGALASPSEQVLIRATSRVARTSPLALFRIHPADGQAREELDERTPPLSDFHFRPQRVRTVVDFRVADCRGR